MQGEKTLIIVESPNKIKTIKQFLGKNYNIKASVGHIRDLPERKLGIDIKKGFAPEYIQVRGKSKVIKDLKKAVDQAEKVFLAPDPDREGEAISWHLAELLGIDPASPCRITFNAITRDAVFKALEKPHPIDMDLVYAQQSRRILDRLMGYQLSPLLWKKIKRGLSAGRVQSVALLMVCEREKTRLTFITEEYWNITADLLTGDEPPAAFTVKLAEYDGKKKVTDEKTAMDIKQRLEKAVLTVDAFTVKEARRYSPLPFVTSTMQQDSFRRYGFPVKKTMSLAQGLYEGRSIGDFGTVGLVTYIRTDSFRIEKEAFAQAQEHITSQFGKEYALKHPRKVKARGGKSGRVEDAHEAIRPTNLAISPEAAALYLRPDELKLYRLIFDRFVASQMQPSLMASQEVKVGADGMVLTAQGTELLFPGFLAAIPKSRHSDFGVRPSLPRLEKGMTLQLESVGTEQCFTQPPPRFTEGSLVKELEKQGIGRPSTYASIIGTLKNRKYAIIEKKKIKPTDLGMVVNDKVTVHFPDLINVDFTALMEENLDGVEDGTTHWQDIVSNFYANFSKKLEEAEKNMEKVRIETDIDCQACGHTMLLQFGRNGEFLTCSNYPKCNGTMNLPDGFSLLDHLSIENLQDKKLAISIKGKVDLEDPSTPAGPDEETGELPQCPECQGTMIKRQGRFGPFLSCSDYPKCKGTKKIIQYIEGECPDCHGRLMVKYSRRGKLFYGCEKYPKCKYASSRKTGHQKKGSRKEKQAEEKKV